MIILDCSRINTYNDIINFLNYNIVRAFKLLDGKYDQQN